MISILIPVYNFNASDLMIKLSEEMKTINKSIEIIVFDDHSCLFQKENRETAEKLRFKYNYLPKNIGRSKIRNALADNATYEYLLYLDGDIIPESKEFIKCYLDHIGHNTEIIYGGRIHEINLEHQSKLRWNYGRYKEDQAFGQRIKRPYLSIATNNLLIKKSLFKKINFEESIQTYGHEDTLLAIHLKERQSNIQHIDNPVVHKDIDENHIFLRKTESALENLKILQTSYDLPVGEIKILKVYNKVERLKLKSLGFGLFKIIEKPLEYYLIKKGRNLRLFDIYKLGYFIKINRE